MSLSGVEASGMTPAGAWEPMDSVDPKRIEHIAVCICTYKRPVLLRRLLMELNRLTTTRLDPPRPP
jgi:hypothetical protein